MNRDQQVLRQGGLLEQNRHVLYLLAPLSAIGIAGVLFENSFAGQEIYIGYVKGLFEPGSGHMSALSTTGEVRARFLWLASCVALISASLAAIAVSCVAIRRSLDGRRRRIAFYLAVALAVAGLLVIQFHAANLRSLNFELTLELLGSSRIFQAGFIDTNVRVFAYAVIVVAGLAAMFLLVAAAGAAAPPAAGAKPDPAAASANMAHLTNVLYAGAIMLVCGILNMGAWMRWPAALFRESERVDAFTGMSLGVTTFWGATFTVVTIAAYVPPALYLRARARRVHEQQHPEAGIAEREQWLRDQGLAVAQGARRAPVLAMASPLLAGPLSSLLNILSTQLTQ